MRLSRALNDKKMDQRLRDKLIADGKVSQADLDQYLANLPDDANNATTTEEVENRNQDS